MKKQLSRLFILVIALLMAMPAAVFATTPPPANAVRGTMSVEYRYMEGETVNIPDEITRFGFRYYKVSQSEPVLESTLPLERTFSFNINGVMSKAQLDLLLEEDWGAGEVTVEPKLVTLNLEMDIEAQFPMAINDVDDIPPGDALFTPQAIVDYILGDNPINEVLVPGITKESDIKDVEVLEPPLVTGVEFDPQGPADLPSSYIATVVYRGYVQFAIEGYSKIDVTYKSDNKSNVNVYIITAEYESDELPAPVEVVTIGGGDVPLGGDGGLSPEDQTLVDNQTGSLIDDIIDGNVPLGNTNVSGTWSLLSMILSVAAVAIAAIFAITLFAKRKREEVIEEHGEDSERLAVIEKRATLLKNMTIILGAMTIIMWLYTDDLSLGVTWINMFTPIAAVLCAVTVALLVFTKMQNNKVKQFIKNMFSGEASVA